MKTITTLAALLLLVTLGAGCGGEETSLTGPPSGGGSNALLSGLTTSAGSLTPGFVASHRSYTVFVPAGTGQITVTARSSSSNPSIKIHGPGLAIDGVTLQSGVPSPAIALSSGDTRITVVSESGDTVMEYTITAKLLSF